MKSVSVQQMTVLPMTTNRSVVQVKDHRYTVAFAFVAGILIGIPITYCVLFLPLWAHGGGMELMDGRSNLPGQQSQSHFEIALPPAAVPEKSGLDDPPPNPLISSLLVKSVVPRHSRQQQQHYQESVIPSHSSDLLTKNFTDKLQSQNRTFKLSDIVNGVQWTPMSERLVPKGFDDYDVVLWKRFLNSTQVLKVEEGCGRMQNRLVTLADGGKSCARYRHNNDQIQGEIFSFYLGRLLGIRNLSPSSLALVDMRTRRWSSAATQIAIAQWSSERPVVLTQFVEGLQPAYIPRQFRHKTKKRLHPIREDLGNVTASDVSELVQWTDLVIFDYLTANLDRVVNNLYNERWNAEMMNQPTHNLAKTSEGLLLFLDNESGLLHGYRLLEKYDHFHRALLEGLCVFRKDTIDAIERLHEGNIDKILRQSFSEYDPGMSNWLPFLPERSLRTLRKRIEKVRDHIRTCKSRYEILETVVLEPPVKKL